MARTLMNREELTQWILRKLGGPLVCVELTQDMLDDAVEDAVRWFIAKKGTVRTVKFNAIPGQVEYDLPEDVDTVLNVWFTERELDFSTIFSPFAFVDKIPYDVFANPRGGGLYSSFTQSLQYIEMAKRIISVEPEWRQIPGTRCLQLNRLDRDDGASLTFVVEYKPNCITVEQLFERDHDLVKRWAFAEAMEVLGRIRSKIDSYPSAQGTLTLNGDRLIDQAQEKKDKLEEEIFDSGFPLGFLTG